MRLRRLALLLALLAACASDDDGTPTPAPVQSDTGLDSPTDATNGEPGPCANPVAPGALEGVVWEWTLDHDLMAQRCASPPTDFLICDGLPAFTEGPVTIRHEIIFTGNGQAVLSLRTDSPDINQQGFLSAPTDFDNNPCLSASFGPMWMDWGGDFEPRIKRTVISAAVSPDLSRLDIATLDFYIDYDSLNDLAGPDACTLGLCEPDRTLRVQLQGITARRVEAPE